MRLAPSSRLWRPAAGTLFILAVSTAVAGGLDQFMPATVVAFVYIVAVLLVAHRYAYRYAFASALAAVALLNILFLHPRGNLRVDSQEHGFGLAALLIVSLLASYLASRQRDFGRAATRNTVNATRLRELASALAVTTQIPDMSAHVLAHLRTRYGAAVLSLLEPAQVEPPRRGAGLTARPERPVPLQGDTQRRPPLVSADAIRHCIHSGQALGAGTGRWNNLPATCVPMISAAGVLGALAVAGSEASRRDDVIELQAVADMFAAAVQRERNAADALEARAHAQSQGLRNTLLASVSHDFRTPLASIIGCASALVQQRDRLAADDAMRLARQIESEARYLADVTENTLNWIRLTSGGPPPDFDWQAIGEILSSVAERARLRDTRRTVQIKLEPDLPLIRGDAVLLAQAVANLVDNALKYSPGPILVSATVHGDDMWIDVADRGDTLSPHERRRIFDSFYRSPHSSGVRGAGLGLSIAQAVAQAHGGTLIASPRLDGGNTFRLELPLTTAPPIALESLALADTPADMLADTSADAVPT